MKLKEPVTVNQPTAAPTRKVAAGGIGGALSIILIYLLQTIFGIVLPAEVASAITLIVGFGTSYLVKESA